MERERKRDEGKTKIRKKHIKIWSFEKRDLKKMERKE